MDDLVAEFLGVLHDRDPLSTTAARYGETLRRFVAFTRDELHQDAVRVEDVDRALVVAFVRAAKGPDATLSPSTRNARLAALRAFFRYLIKEQNTAADPTEHVERVKLHKRSPTFLTFAEFDKLRRAVERTATEHYLRRDLAIVTTLFHTGLRLRELLSLNLDQVDHEREEFLAVRRKGGDHVNVVFNVEVTIALRRWLWERRTYPNAADDEALFLSDRGRRISPRAVQDLVAKYAKAAKLDQRVTPHTFRHGYTTELLRRGNRIEVVGRLLHHKSLETTRGYVHLVGEELHAAANTLSREPKAAAR